MTTLQDAISYLKDNGIECFDLMNILIIPSESSEDLDVKVSKVTKLLSKCGYQGNWQIDPYYYENHSGLTSEMFDNAIDSRNIQ